MSRFVIITPDQSFAQTTRLAAAGMPGSLQHFNADYLPAAPIDVLGQLVGEPPEVFLLGPGLAPEEAVKFAALLDLQYPEISVVLVDHQTPDLVILAMRAGVRDIVAPDADVDSVRALLERAGLAAAGRRRGLMPSPADELAHHQGGRIVAVISPKGGVGKTTVATNLAVGLGKSYPMGVVVVDLDLQFGDVASGLMIEPQHTITDAVVGAASQDSMVLKTYLSMHPSNIYALCAPRNPVEMDHISADDVKHLLAQLQQEFQFVVVDTAPGLGEHVLATLELATDAVWICGMDVPSIRGLRTGIEILSELELLPPRRHVVLNMADRRSGLTLADVESTIGAPVDVVLPRSRALPFATNKGVPVLQEGSRDPAARGLMQLVDRFKPNWEARPHKRLHRRAVLQ